MIKVFGNVVNSKAYRRVKELNRALKDVNPCDRIKVSDVISASKDHSGVFYFTFKIEDFNIGLVHNCLNIFKEELGTKVTLQIFDFDGSWFNWDNLESFYITQLIEKHLSTTFSDFAEIEPYVEFVLVLDLTKKVVSFGLNTITNNTIYEYSDSKDVDPAMFDF